MTDREKVIGILSDITMYCLTDSEYEAICDALAMLKAQEPVKPKVNIDTWVCGNCGTRLEHQSLIGPNAVLAETFNFCPGCGRAVKWDD